MLFRSGPEIARILAMFGADVIHVESPKRPDPIRFNSIKEMSEDDWWEWSPLYHGPNANKRSLSLDLSSSEGREILVLVTRYSAWAEEMLILFTACMHWCDNETGSPAW